MRFLSVVLRAISKSLTPLFFTLIGTMAAVTPEELISHAAKWGHWLGFDRLPNWVTNPATDYWVIVISVIGFVVSTYLLYAKVPVPIPIERIAFLNRVPLYEATRRLYEAIEEAGFASVTGILATTAAEKLDHLEHKLLIDASEGALVIYAKQPPSRKYRPIPRDQVSNLAPVEGTSNLIPFAIGGAQPSFRDACVSRIALRRIIKDHIAYLRSITRPL